MNTVISAASGIISIHALTGSATACVEYPDLMDAISIHALTGSATKAIAGDI